MPIKGNRVFGIHEKLEMAMGSLISLKIHQLCSKKNKVDDRVVHLRISEIIELAETLQSLSSYNLLERR